MKGLALIYRKFVRLNHQRWEWPEKEMEERHAANEAIYNLLISDKPCFIGRIGTSEGQVIDNYLSVHKDRNYIFKMIDYIKGNARLPWWDTVRPFNDVCTCSGFFPAPATIESIERFSELYLKYIPTIDLCGRFEYYEHSLPFGEKCQYHQLETLYPFFVDNSWMRALKGKNVLVIHPFKSAIESQYQKREVLFSNKDWLPEFESLTVIKAVQTLAGEKCEFADWFEALDSMKQQIDQTDFDVAIIGCGAYALPLSGYCKEIGKKAIHMGGGLQLLFGIKGKRWEEQYRESCYRDMFNEYWIYPGSEGCPKSAKRVENACYW